MFERLTADLSGAGAEVETQISSAKTELVGSFAGEINMMREALSDHKHKGEQQMAGLQGAVQGSTQAQICFHHQAVTSLLWISRLLSCTL